MAGGNKEYRVNPDGTRSRREQNPDGSWGPWTQVYVPPEAGEARGNNTNSATLNPDHYKDKAYIPQEKRQATADYMAYVKWKRSELANLMKTYRTEFPKQIEAFQRAAFGELDTKAPEMWGQRHVNLQQRGLEDSPNFLAGAQQAQENWLTGEKQGIKDTAASMKREGQDALLAAVGKPDYAANYQNWGKYTQQMNEYLTWLRNNKKGA